jgi:hypothetical protein
VQKESLFDFFSACMMLILFNACGVKKGANPIKNLKIVDKPIVWDSLRKRLSLEYMYNHYGMTDVRTPLITPSMVVIHWTAIPTLAASFNAFKPAVLEGREELQEASRLNVGIHFLVDRDGTIIG